MKNFIFLFFLFSGLIFSQVISQFQFISPIPDSDFNNRESTIIIREGSFIDDASLSENSIKVVGSKSGIISGEIILSTDQKTVIFKPDKKFAPNEKVTVIIPSGLAKYDGRTTVSLEFSFTITALSEPIKINDQNLNSFNGFNRTESKLSSGLNEFESVNTDSLPDDFPEFEIIQNEETASGYLFGSSNSSVDSIGNYFMILNNLGEPKYYSQELSAGRLLETGLFGVASPLGPKHQYIWYIKNSTFTVVDSFQMGNGYIADNHDFILLPNGHAIMLAYDIQIIDMSKIIEGGQPNAQVTGSIIQELDVEKNVVYQWRCWDHIPITDSYKDVTKPRFDYIHVNSVELDNDDHIILSCRETSEVIKISRETGETIWRWGGKNNDFTTIGDHEENAPRYFKLQHSVRRLPNGNIIMFDNGADKNDKQRDYTRAVEYAMDEVNMTATMVWEFRHDPDILALTGGTVVRLPNGNTSINWGGASRDGTAPAYTEVNPEGELAYEISIKGEGVYGNFSRYLWFDLDPTQIVTHYEIMEGNTYDFTEGDSIETGISVKINSFTGESYNEMTVKREPYGPLYAEFFGRAPVVFPVRVNISGVDIASINADITFDLEKFDFTDLDSVLVYHREFAGSGLFLPLASDYNHVTNTLRATITKFGELVVGKPDFKSVAYAPILVSPADSEAINYSIGLDLLWTPVGYVNEYRIQVSNSNSFGDLIIDQEYQTTTSLRMDSLENNLTYYWRVKSINDAGESVWSDTGIFTTTSPKISLTIPNGGESWHVGLEYWIRWDDNILEDVEIHLLNNDMSIIELIDTSPSGGAYLWEINPTTSVGLYKVRIRSIEDTLLNSSSTDYFNIIDTVTNVDGSNNTLVTSYKLHQNFPNPFNPTTSISYELVDRSDVRIEIYDVLGVKIAEVINQVQDAGIHQVEFNSVGLVSGVYLYNIIATSITGSKHYSHVKKMIVLK
ncbi:aryl-sulfate sulfotransferase [Bacteroidota bacterium]